MNKASIAVNILSNVVNVIPTIIKAVKKGQFEIKYFKILPEETQKEKDLAEERKNNGDTFHPSYKEYLSILDQGKKENQPMVIKWERNYSDSQWTVHILQPNENYEYEK